MFYINIFLKKWEIYIKTPVSGSCFSKTTGWTDTTLIKMPSSRVCSQEFCEISNNKVFSKHIWETDSKVFYGKFQNGVNKYIMKTDNFFPDSSASLEKQPSLVPSESHHHSHYHTNFHLSLFSMVKWESFLMVALPFQPLLYNNFSFNIKYFKISLHNFFTCLSRPTSTMLTINSPASAFLLTRSIIILLLIPTPPLISLNQVPP